PAEIKINEFNFADKRRLEAAAVVAFQRNSRHPSAAGLQSRRVIDHSVRKRVALRRLGPVLCSAPAPARRATMFTYSKLAQAGIAAVSYLAGISLEGRLAGSAEIADDRQLSRALVAKVLTLLSAA